MWFHPTRQKVASERSKPENRRSYYRKRRRRATEKRLEGSVGGFTISTFLWREEILHGLLGADLIGFHTHGYTRHFLSSVTRVCGIEHSVGEITVDTRSVKIDALPLDIDYDKYANAAQDREVRAKIENVQSPVADRRAILSINRLDYAKGIIERPIAALQETDGPLQRNRRMPGHTAAGRNEPRRQGIRSNQGRWQRGPGRQRNDRRRQRTRRDPGGQFPRHGGGGTGNQASDGNVCSVRKQVSAGSTMAARSPDSRVGQPWTTTPTCSIRSCEGRLSNRFTFLDARDNQCHFLCPAVPSRTRRRRRAESFTQAGPA